MKRVLIAAGIFTLASLGVLAHPARRAATPAPAAPTDPIAAAAPAAPSTPATPAAPATPSASSVQAAPTAPTAPSAPPAQAAVTKSPASFEQMKSLLGEWEGEAGDKHVGHASFKLVSSGTAVMETLHPTEAEDMITVYYPDGDRLMLTHYCASNNQPRMRTDSANTDPKKLVFNYVDATNLAASREGVMTGLTVTFVDADHFTQTWTWRDKVGGEPKMETFQYTRKK
jgi:hypothetical protein